MRQTETTETTNRPERSSIIVPKKNGEAAIRLLSTMGILDRNLNFVTTNQTLMLPLTRPIDQSELRLLLSQVPDALSGRDKFEPRERVPKTLNDRLSQIIPPDLLSRLPKSYDIVGELSILDLDPDLIPYEKSVAESILEIHPNVKAVYTKAGSVSGTDRVRPLRHLAGKEQTETIHLEFGCRFKIDIAKAFFSPRLSTEHDRVARQVRDRESVIDMFAGVGPFSILIAKMVQSVTINAVDSNQDAVRLMEENVRLNNVGSKVQVHYGDARVMVEQRLQHKANRVIMNHPSASMEFVHAACDALLPTGGIVHYYTFSRGEDPEVEAKEELERAVSQTGGVIENMLAVRRVREVAPVKWQMAVDARVVPAKG